MSKLQNYFTTFEQSKRLLELGVPTNSADCYYDQYQILNFRTELDYGYDFFELNFRFIPCWSVGRLIEIYCLCVDERYSIEFIGQIHTRPMNKILDLFEFVKFDFSKLE